MESQPRSSTSERDSGPVYHFENHLKFLSDSYLNFFTERRRVEETYIELLGKLHKKVRSIDQYLDERNELGTTRRAWSEIRDSVERETQARTAFVASLTFDVINPLTTLKETQERTRKRIKEDLKESSNAYYDHTNEVLPRLKSRYLKKWQEVEETKKAPLVPPISPTSPGFTNLPQMEAKALSSSPPRPVVTSPQPLRALDRRPSGSGVGHAARNRSPSSSGAFSDLAHQGKRQLNQLRGFLEKNNTVKEVKETLAGSKSENLSLRNVRTKREADEADKEYRKGVHWAETLRLRRNRILEAGYTSLEMFMQETSLTIKSLLQKYIDNMIATHTTQSQLYNHCQTAVDAISPEKDVQKHRPQFIRSYNMSKPDPTYYQHGGVGICKDLIFGFSLLDYATGKGLQDGEVPKVVRICIREVDQRGLDAEGIYRVSGRLAAIQSLKLNLEKDEDAFRFHHNDDIYAVASLLKAYLRESPEPVFKFTLQDRIQHTEDIDEHRSNNFVLLRSKMRRLPPVHFATLKVLVEHLARVTAHSDKNKMDAKNLAIIFGAVIFGEDDVPKSTDLLSVQNWRDTLMEDLIVNATILFDENTTASHPLPPTPVGETPAPAFYGSQHTRVASVPATPQTTSTKLPEDFTPQMPTHPAKSIHPSSRGNPPSPSKERFAQAIPRKEDSLYLPMPLSPGTSRSSTDALSLSSSPSPARDDTYEDSLRGGTASFSSGSSVPTLGKDMESTMDPFTVEMPDVDTPPVDSTRMPPQGQAMNRS